MCPASVFTPSSLFLLGGEVTFFLMPLREHHPFYLLLWKNSGQLSSQAEMLVNVQWRPGLVSKLNGVKASPFGYRFKASNEADFSFPLSCVSCLDYRMFLTVLRTHYIWRKESKWRLLLEGWDHPVKVSRGRDEEAKSGKPSIQGCGSHTVLPRVLGSKEVPSGLPGEETREQITTSSQNHHLCFYHSSCDFLLFIWGLGIHKFHLLKKFPLQKKKNSLKTSGIKNEHRKEQFTKGSADDLPKTQEEGGVFAN